MEALFEEGAEELISKAKSMALAGDTAAMRLCLERIFPARKDRLIHLDLPPLRNAKEISAALSTTIRAVGDGEITPAEGEIVANMLAAQSQVVMAEELESRLEKVESLAEPEKAG
jgi:hypothetical protein